MNRGSNRWWLTLPACTVALLLGALGGCPRVASFLAGFGVGNMLDSPPTEETPEQLDVRPSPEPPPPEPPDPLIRALEAFLADPSKAAENAGALDREIGLAFDSGLTADVLLAKLHSPITTEEAIDRLLAASAAVANRIVQLDAKAGAEQGRAAPQVIFINGISVDYPSFVVSLYALRDHLRQADIDLPVAGIYNWSETNVCASPDPFDCDTAFGGCRGDWLDLREAAYEWSLIQAPLLSAPQSLELAPLRQYAATILSSGAPIIFVAHSQGNHKVLAAFSSLFPPSGFDLPNWNRSVGVVMVGSPIGERFFQDKDIAAVRISEVRDPVACLDPPNAAVQNASDRVCENSKADADPELCADILRGLHSLLRTRADAVADLRRALLRFKKFVAYHGFLRSYLDGDATGAQLTKRILELQQTLLRPGEPAVTTVSLEAIGEPRTLNFGRVSGSLELVISPQDADGNFTGEGLTEANFRLRNVRLVPADGGTPVRVGGTVTSVKIQPPVPGRAITAVVALDSSGSMGVPDPNSDPTEFNNDVGAIGRSAGVRAFLSALDADDRVAVMDFGYVPANRRDGFPSTRRCNSCAAIESACVSESEAADFIRLLSAFRPPSDPELLGVLDCLSECGGTPLYEAMDAGLCLLEEQTGGSGGVLVVVTDGRPDGFRSDMTQTVDNAVSHGVRIYTVALGENADETALAAVAERTGGSFVRADDAAGLSAVFAQIGATAKEGSVAVSARVAYEDVAPGRYRLEGTLCLVEDSLRARLASAFGFCDTQVSFSVSVEIQQ